MLADPRFRQSAVRQFIASKTCKVGSVNEGAAEHAPIGEFTVGSAAGRPKERHARCKSLARVILEPIERTDPGRELCIGINGPVRCDPCFASHEVDQLKPDGLPGRFRGAWDTYLATINADSNQSQDCGQVQGDK